MRKLIIVLAASFLFACSGSISEKDLSKNADFSEYISGYSSGVISKASSIQIELKNAQQGEIDYENPIDKDLFAFEPSINGKAFWVNRNTIEFTPGEYFTTDQEYFVKFHLGNLIDVPSDQKDFVFKFKTLSQSYSSDFYGLKSIAGQLENQYLEGFIYTNDLVDSTLIEKLIVANQDGNELSVKWEKISGQSFKVRIDGIKRLKTDSEIKINYNGSSIGVKDDDRTQTIEVPALGEFKIMSVKVYNRPEQYLNIHFSDPLDESQDIKGFVTVSNTSKLNFLIEGHDIKIYFPGHISGEKKVKIYPGIKNVIGTKYNKQYEEDIQFEELKPDLKLISEGTILPSTIGAKLNFEAVNLSAVDVYVTKVFEKNMIQFFQVNDFDRSRELKRVSKKILHKKVSLEISKGDANKWKQYSLDLSEVVNNEPGAIYRVEVKIRKPYSLYECEGDDSKEDEVENEDEGWSERNWDSYDYYYDDYYYDDYYYDYDYNDRLNPCKDYYYNGKGFQTNIFVSDIGLIAKAGKDQTMHVFTTSISSAKPLSGTKINFYDFNQELLGSASADGNGYCSLKLDKKPFIIIAENGKEKGYLKLRDGESLSYSKFDVAGSGTQRGVKGVLYGERGVWRPGDSLFLTFVLEDKENLIEDNHPVKFELFNSRGQSIEKITTSNNVNGFYNFSTKTSNDAPTGNYRAVVKVGNRYFTKYLKIETVKPNRLKVNLTYDGDYISSTDESKDLELFSQWLHGAPGTNLKAQVSLDASSKITKFKGFEKYSFDDPIKRVSTSEYVVFKGNLDSEGKAKIKIDKRNLSAAPGKINLHFMTKVFEGGGNFSVNNTSLEYSPYDKYIGVKSPKGKMYGGAIETDIQHQFDIISLNEDGSPTSISDLDVKIYKVSWNWWYDSYNRNLSDYIHKQSTIPVFKKKVSTNSSGKASFKFGINRPEYGRYLIHVKNKSTGHSTGQMIYIDWPYWARSNRKDQENLTVLPFSTDKESYTVGEKVKVSFPSNENSKALVSIESGTRIIQHFWANTTEGETKLEFDVTPEMSPNAFVYISLIQPHAETINDLPLRMYGVIPIMVDDPETHLDPQIEMKDVLRPETTTEIKVSEKNGKEMSYTLAVVDEGLLDLTNFKTPNLWKYFYAREALGVKTWDLFDHVMGAFDGELSKVLAVGGDGEIDPDKMVNNANRFVPMVRFIGPFQLDKNKTVSHKIDVPNYVGSVRVMVIAGKDKKYGSVDKTVPVRNPLMVLGTLPRVLGPGEKIKLPVDVFAMEKQIKNVSLEINVSGPIAINGESKKKITFEKEGDKIVDFDIDVKEEIGIAKVSIIAKSGSETARHDIEIAVRPSNPKTTEVYEKVLEANESWNPEVILNGIKGTNHLKLEVSSIPSIDLERRLDYLIQYPHGCIEQTTSSVFPQLYLSKITELDNQRKRQIDLNVKESFNRLINFQTNAGGFGYWQGSQTVSEWGTNYATHYIVEAEKIGYAVPSSLKRNAINYLTSKANSWNSKNTSSYYRSDDLVQAYRLYVLALANSPQAGAMNRLREKKNLSLQAKWRLAAAYELSGKSSIAKEIIFNLNSEISDYNEHSYSYGSRTRDLAMILETQILLGDKVESAKMLKKIATELSSNKWMSTQTTAYSLLSVAKYLEKNKTSSSTNLSYVLDKKKGSFSGKSTIYSVESRNVQKTTQTLNIQNKGVGTLFITVLAQGYPVTSSESANQSKLKMNIKYYGLNGSLINPSSINQGTDFYAQVDIDNTSSEYIDNIALSQIFPSGWEINNSRMDGSNSTSSSSFTYEDVRDDRVYTYFSLGSRSKKSFKFKLNASYAGRYYLPSVVCEAMYDNSIQARVVGKWVEVIN